MQFQQLDRRDAGKPALAAVDLVYLVIGLSHPQPKIFLWSMSSVLEILDILGQFHHVDLWIGRTYYSHYDYICIYIYMYCIVHPISIYQHYCSTKNLVIAYCTCRITIVNRFQRGLHIIDPQRSMVFDIAQFGPSSPHTSIWQEYCMTV